MKRNLAICICILLICVMIAGCAAGVQTPKDTGSQAPQTSVPALDGEKIDTDKFTMTAAKGWNKMDIPGGVQLYSGNDVLQVSVSGYNVTEAEDLALLEDMVKQYNGTPAEQVELLGITFYKTSFTANGSDQTFYSCVRDGEQVKIQLAGKDHQKNANILAMMDSIKLK